MGATKIYGLDISEGMLKEAKRILTEKGIIDKFELICADIFADDFKLDIKVDCVVMCYVTCTFINRQDVLNKLFQRAKAFLKEDGYILLTDVCWTPH